MANVEILRKNLESHGFRTSFFSNPQEAADYLRNLPFRDKVHLLAHFGMELKNIPKWQLYGSAVYWKENIKEGLNPATNTSQQTLRHTLTVNYDLPVGEEYRRFITRQIT